MDKHPTFDFIEQTLKAAPQIAPIFGLAPLGDHEWDSIWAPALDMVGRGGKRWRSLLFADVLCTLRGMDAASLVGEAYGAGGARGAGDTITNALSAIEYMHAGSLIVDDIEDASPLRRGTPASHKLFGLDMALNTGCFMYLYAIEAAAQAGAAYGAQAEADARALASMMLGRLHAGQGLDILWHRDSKAMPSIAAYEEMVSGKTSALIMLSVGLAYILAGEHLNQTDTPERYMSLLKASRHIGIAFQIYDDLLNLLGGVKGKVHGDDLLEGKKSFPLVCAYQRGTHLSYDAETLRTASEADLNIAVARICRELEASGAFAEAIAIGHEHYQTGLLALCELLPHNLAHKSWWDSFLDWGKLTEARLAWAPAPNEEPQL